MCVYFSLFVHCVFNYVQFCSFLFTCCSVFSFIFMLFISFHFLHFSSLEKQLPIQTTYMSTHYLLLLKYSFRKMHIYIYIHIYTHIYRWFSCFPAPTKTPFCIGSCCLLFIIFIGMLCYVMLCYFLCYLCMIVYIYSIYIYIYLRVCMRVRVSLFAYIYIIYIYIYIHIVTIHKSLSFMSMYVYNEKQKQWVWWVWRIYPHVLKKYRPPTYSTKAYLQKDGSWSMLLAT